MPLPAPLPLPSSMRQLVLPLQPAPAPSLDNFIPGSNAEVLAALGNWRSGQLRSTGFLLWGTAGSGCSHLLQALARDAGCPLLDAAQAPDLAGLHPAQLPAGALVVVDHVDRLDAAGQQTLFNAYNALLAHAGQLLCAASAPPAGLALREELRTRLGQGLIYRVETLSDAEKRAALRQRAEQHGMTLTAEALDYLFARAPRDMRSLTALLAAIDLHALERQRPITLPLLREVLQQLPDPSSHEPGPV